MLDVADGSHVHIMTPLATLLHRHELNDLLSAVHTCAQLPSSPATSNPATNPVERPRTPVMAALQHLQLLDGEQEWNLFRLYGRVPAWQDKPPGWRTPQQEAQVRSAGDATVWKCQLKAAGP